MAKKQVTIYDTTLRDGTQGQGISLSSRDKLRIAEKLDQFGADYIEGGWPGSNPKDVEFFEEAAKRSWSHAKIAAFGSTRRADLGVEDDPQVKLLIGARTPVVTIFGKSWKLHVTEVLRTTGEENCAMIRDTCRYLKENGREVVYDAEHFFDGYKDDSNYALSTLEAAKEGGADILVLCDTNGGTLPSEVKEITRVVKKNLDMAVGIHTHDDSGLGVANALAAVEEGAEQIQATINGYGERTGNCNMTSALPNLQLKMGIKMVENLDQLTALSHFVDDLANSPHDPRAPFVGTTAFSHKGGMHVNAVQKLAETYEHIRPEEVGNEQRILVSELSGQSNVLLKAKAMGFEMEKGDPVALSILGELKRLEKEGYEFEAAEASFELLLREKLGQKKVFFELLEYNCSSRHDGASRYGRCSATVKLKAAGEERFTVAEGSGPVDALDAALRKALEPVYPQLRGMNLEDYRVRIIDSQLRAGAKTRVLLDSTDGERSWSTVGVSSDIIAASWEALVDSVEYFLVTHLR